MKTGSEDSERKRPNTSAFYQQKLSGWQPLITTNNLYIPFFIVGIISVIVGSVLVYFAYQIEDLSVDYTNCVDGRGRICADILTEQNLTNHFGHCTCVMNLTLSSPIEGQTYVYYGLTKFFQNHRRYLRSKDDKQLRGKPVAELSSDCQPYQYANETTKTQYTPCGMIANSIFNDTFSLSLIDVTNQSKQPSNELVPVPWSDTGIAWPSETKIRFGIVESWANTAKPPNWPRSALQRSPKAFSGDEELIVWMRNAAFPDFRKMHRRIMHQPETPFAKGLPDGNYVLSINYSYPVKSFGGTKQFILATTNSLGGKNPRAGFILLSLGAVYISFAVSFVFINTFVARRKLNEVWIAAAANRNSGLVHPVSPPLPAPPSPLTPHKSSLNNCDFNEPCFSSNRPRRNHHDGDTHKIIVDNL